MRDPETDILARFEGDLAVIVTDINIEGKDSDVAQIMPGLAEALRSLKKFSQDANALGAQVTDTLGQGAAVVAQVADVHRDVKTALAEVQAELGGITNGGPPLETPPALPDAGRRGDPPNLTK